MDSLIKFKNKLLEKPIDELKELFIKAKYNYYNADFQEKIIFDDDQFDLLQELIKQKDPDFNVDEIGATPIQNKATLPYFLASLNKIKETDEKLFINWKLRFNYSEYIIEEKLDGVSALLVYDFIKNTTELFTRGNGKIGTNISFLIEQINSIPSIKDFKNLNKLAIRGELIINIDVFNEKYKTFSNARNLVSGLINSINPNLDDSVDFVSYEIVYQETQTSDKISDNLEKLNNWNFKIPKFNLIPNELLELNVLSLLLDKMKKESIYEIDGLVVQPNFYLSNLETNNPKNIFAFKKMYEKNIKETRVIKVIWNITKFGYLKPKLEVESVEISGVIINFVTAHNAKYIVSNNIGPDTIIQITRSGDVIPYIVSIVSSTVAQMPDIKYTWLNDVDIKINDIDDNDKVCIKRFSDFFQYMDVEDISEKTIEKFINAGFKSLFDILNMTLNDFYKIDGFKYGGIMAQKTYDNIKRGMENRNIEDILVASSVLGQGISRERIKTLLKYIPNILEYNMSEKENKEILKEKLLKIPSFGYVITQTIITNLEDSKKFINEFYKIYPKIKFDLSVKDEVVIENENNDQEKDKKLKDIIITFSNVRNKLLEQKIQENGGIVKNNFTKKTNILIISSESDETTKVNQAKKWGIPIKLMNDFIEEYNL
jgi:DNA ligase (NAD+)